MQLTTICTVRAATAIGNCARFMRFEYIFEFYATKGPKWLGEQLGVRTSTIIMRARKLGLPPLQ